MAVAATGFFDGVHLGHRAILQILKDIAEKEGTESAVVTFWPHPRNVLQQDASTLRLLNSLNEKEKLIKDFGIDRFEILPFTRSFSRMTTAEFLRECLVEKLGITTLIIGYDHRLGCDSVATREELAQIAAEVGLKTVIVEEFQKDHHKISSTQIRHLLSDGDVEGASNLLGYNYNLHGVVVLGNRIGRTIGFPTANMELYEPLKAVPANGVYLVRVQVLGQEHYGICNVGTRPTVGASNTRTIETHIFDFSENIYGLDLRIEFLKHLREERRFPSLDALKAQIESDKQQALQSLKA